MADATWDSHDRDTGAYCGGCGSDTTSCADCRDAQWRAAVERVRSPQGYSSGSHTDGFNTALDALLAAMEGK